ncbi:MAG TPA: hypothetical protein VIO94_15445 [Phenylobacterium sp.]
MEEIDILRAAGVEPKFVGGVLLLTVDQVRVLLLMVERKGWIIWGLDGFEIVDRGVRPDMDEIADWSDLEKTAGDQLSLISIEATTWFLDTVARADRSYEVVISERA